MIYLSERKEEAFWSTQHSLGQRKDGRHRTTKRTIVYYSFEERYFIINNENKSKIKDDII